MYSNIPVKSILNIQNRPQYSIITDVNTDSTDNVFERIRTQVTEYLQSRLLLVDCYFQIH